MAGGAPPMMAFTYIGLSTTMGALGSGALSSVPIDVTRKPKSTLAGNGPGIFWARDP